MARVWQRQLGPTLALPRKPTPTHTFSCQSKEAIKGERCHRRYAVILVRQFDILLLKPKTQKRNLLQAHQQKLSENASVCVCVFNVYIHTYILMKISPFIAFVFIFSHLIFLSRKPSFICLHGFANECYIFISSQKTVKLNARLRVLGRHQCVLHCFLCLIPLYTLLNSQS